MRTPVLACKLNILVVEDNADLRQLLCDLLQNFGHLTMSAESAEEALIHMQACSAIDVLLTDVSLPGKSGIDLAREVIAMQPCLHVVFASGYNKSFLENLDFPAHLLTKPYDIDQLQALLISLATSQHPAATAVCIS